MEVVGGVDEVAAYAEVDGKIGHAELYTCRRSERHLAPHRLWCYAIKVDVGATVVSAVER